MSTTKVELWNGPLDGRIFIWTDPPPIEFRMPIPALSPKLTIGETMGDHPVPPVVAVYIRKDREDGIWMYDWEGYQ